MNKPDRRLLVFIFSFLPLMPLQADELSQAFELVKNSVVSIEADQNKGAGVLIAGKNEIMTAADIVQTADWVEVRFAPDQVVSARVQSSAMQADVALLDLEGIPEGIKGVKLGDSDKITVGQQVFVVTVASGNNPRMLGCRITGRWKPETVMENFLQGDFLQIDSKLDRDDAGSPLFNAKGEVIGIVSNVLSSSTGFSGMGFAIPSNLAVKLTLNEPFFWSGLSGRLLSGASAHYFGLPQGKGFLIEKISEVSPSAKLGLRAGTKSVTVDGKTLIAGGDIVLAVDGISFNADDAMNQIRRHLRTIVNGGVVHVKIFRDGKTEDLSSTFER